LGFEFRVLGLGLTVQGVEFMEKGLRFKVWCLRTLGLGFRVYIQGVGYRIQGWS
jgi:hypothetical protein